MQIAILKMLQFSANTLLVLGISIFILTGINELVVSPNIETIQISTFQIFTFELIILLIGLVFLGSFLYNYRNLNKEFREAINEIKGWTE